MLPDAVEASIGQGDRLASVNFSRDVGQQAVAQLNCVKQPEQRDGRFLAPRIEFEYPFAAHGGVRVFAQRRERIGFHRAATAYLALRIHVAGGECDDAAAWIPFANPRRDEGVDGPGCGGILRGAEFQTDEVDDVL